MTAPDRIWITDKEVCGYFWEESELSLEDCFEPNVEYIRKGAFPVERLKIESEKTRDAVEAALTAELRWVINEVLSLLEGEK